MDNISRRQRLENDAKALQETAFALLVSVKDQEIAPLIYARFIHYADQLIFLLSHGVRARPSLEAAWLNDTETVLMTATKELASIAQTIARLGGPSKITTIGLAAALPRRPLKVI